ncbi:TonB-dependent receptor, partial [Pseudomonas donghuensis]|nr:TonB-dependent receptor [Pseudomonas donghuensis]
DLNSPLLTTQTGKRSFSNKDIKTEFALMSSPDVVKTLQRVSGVAEGQELASGLYVHGGNGDENLYLIDGTPLYDTNHALGLFSSFNADVVK